MTQKPAFGPEQFPAGTTIIRQGDAPDRFYIITSGRVEVVELLEDQTERALNILKAGEYFGEIGLITRNPRNATVRALSDVNVMSMDRRTFARWVNSSTEIQQEIKDLVLTRLAKPPETIQPPREERYPPVELPPIKTGFFDVEHMEHLEMFMPGRNIVQQGEVADRFFIIIEGTVEVFVEYGDGEEVFMDELEAGDYFGEVGLLERGTRIATVRAKTAVKLIVFDRDTFVGWMKSNPDSQYEIETVSNQRLMDTGRLTLPPPELFEEEED
ncbi:MAG: cyclic nucleotide-binding domain-containing protein [Chloroflexota bacterium]